jgi:hypothetical protein
MTESPFERLAALEREVTEIRKLVDLLLAERRARLEARDQSVKRQIGIR